MAKTKKYALNNSYFKNCSNIMPQNPLDVVLFYRSLGELPFKYEGDNWVYDMFCEYQKRHSIRFEQFLTPDSTAIRMAQLLLSGIEIEDIKTKTALEIGCGTGQITKLLFGLGSLQAFDIDEDMISICENLYDRSNFHFYKYDFKEDNTYYIKQKYDCVISNPPYSNIASLLDYVYRSLKDDGKAVLLLPIGTFQKTRPKILVKMINQFEIIHREPMVEPFLRTGIKAEITVLTKRLS